MQTQRLSECLRAFEIGFAKRDSSAVYEWAERNLRLRESPYGNQFKPSETPWLKEPLACVADPEIETIVARCAAQTGKTISMQVATAWALANHPAPTMVVMQDEDAVKDLAKERMLPMIESCEPLRNQFPEDRHRKTNTEIFFASCTLKMGAANNNFLRSWSIRWMFGDEVSAWKPGMVKRARARTTRYWNRKHWFSSTPEDEGDDFDLEYRNGTCEVWSLRCQGCAALFYPSFYDCVKWDASTKNDDDEWDFDALAKTVRMVCPQCHHPHENTEHNWRLMVNGGGYVQTNPNPNPKTRSFSFNQLTLPPSVMPWASLVIDFLQAKRTASTGFITPLREFVTLRLAEPWKESNHIDVQKVVAASYDPGSDWADESHRFLTVDCQQYLEDFWAVVRAWAPGGESRLLAFRRLSSFDDVRALQQEFKVADSKTFLDVGYERSRVLEACAKYGWIGMRGEDVTDYAHQLDHGKVIRRPHSKPNRTSAGGKISPPVFRWSNPTIKDMLHLLKTGRGKPWEICDLGDMADDYARQTDSERKKEHVDRNGRSKLLWTQIRRDNHAWDCECMQLVAAIICKLLIEPQKTEP